MTIEKRLERLEDAAADAERPLRNVVLRFNDQTDAQAIAARGRPLRPGAPTEFIHVVGVAPAHHHEGAEA